MTIAVTGASGYVGRRLAVRLAADPSARLRLVVRNKAKVADLAGPGVEVVEADTLDAASLRTALAGVETAYYLVHSLGAGKGFPDLERRSAVNFRDACAAAGVRRIIYLGGLGRRETSSPHLRSRLETGETLSAAPPEVRVIWFRAGIIIGAGSASFEIIRHLVRKLPVMLTPRWIRTRTQPIGIEDVVAYLARAKDVPLEASVVVDIGGEVMTFRDMLLRTARVMGLRRVIVPVPFLTPRLSAAWLVFVTPVDTKIARALVEGLKSPTVAENDASRLLFPDVRPAPFEQTVRRALDETEADRVLSRWCDSGAGATCAIRDLDHIPSDARVMRYAASAPGLSAADLFAAASAVGGRNGWFGPGWLWRLRGLMDKMAGGPGLSRGRRAAAALRPGDSLDFWKVAAIDENRRLLLASEMKMPGQGWLEFITQDGRLEVAASFRPRGPAGRLYWTLTGLLHRFVFPALAGGIVRRARRERPDGAGRNDHEQRY
jgi:uncharacterized protein YbjT (DUF2867 family)